MRSLATLVALGSLALPATPPLLAQTTVPVQVWGVYDPWLAGMPAGSTASLGDVAPFQSPLLVSGLPFAPGDVFTFSATGGVAHGVTFPLQGPDGGPNQMHTTGAENGISDINVPLNSLVGVFLGPLQPNLSPAPAALDFGTAGSRDFIALFPLLKQVFFIGDGRTSGNAVQQFIAPAGATRLFLGTMDGFEWSNNVGVFNVNVTLTPTAVPEPSAIALVATGLLAVGGAAYRRKRMAR